MKIRSKLISKRYINDDTVVLRFERGEFEFKAGQYLVISLPDQKEAREYSIYSGENEPFLEILIKTLPEGSFSVKLGDLEPGAPILIDGPYGFFVLKDNEITTHKHVFIATGTGISPFKSYLKSHPELNYHLLHGIRWASDKIDSDFFISATYCITREDSGDYQGRVTDYLADNLNDLNAIYHLCGNSAMINEVSDLLEKAGVKPTNIRTEAFF